MEMGLSPIVNLPGGLMLEWIIETHVHSDHQSVASDIQE